MTPRAWQALAVGATGAWLALVAAGGVFKFKGRADIAQVCGVASLPWLFVALWADARARGPRG